MRLDGLGRSSSSVLALLAHSGASSSKTRGSGEVPEIGEGVRREKRDVCSPGSMESERQACRGGWIPARDQFSFEGGIVGKKKGGEGGVVGGFIGAGWCAEGARVSEEAAIRWLEGVPSSGRACPEVDAESDKRATAVSGGTGVVGVPLRERAPGGPWAGCWPGPECCPAAFLGFSLFAFPFFSNLL
jgi:hypothetical protein